MFHLLTIAGSDSSGGAGIQADLKTFAAHGCYGMSVITAVTAQNTTGVTAIQNIDPEVVEAQIDAVFQDIRVDGVKVGMVSNSALIRAIAKKMQQYAPPVLVVDPVMVATSGSYLLEKEARKDLQEKLLPLATLITPNMQEGEALSGLSIHSREDMEKAAAVICQKGARAVLLKGDTWRKPLTTTCCIPEKGTGSRASGSRASGLPIPTPTAPAAACPPPWLLKWRPEPPCRKRWKKPKPMWPWASSTDWRWAMAMDPSIISWICTGKPDGRKANEKIRSEPVPGDGPALSPGTGFL